MPRRPSYTWRRGGDPGEINSGGLPEATGRRDPASA